MMTTVWYKVELVDNRGRENFSLKAMSKDGAKELIDDLLLRSAVYRTGNMIRVYRGPEVVAIWKFDDRSGVFVRLSEEELNPFKCYRRLRAAF
jgi:hypothetical protein